MNKVHEMYGKNTEDVGSLIKKVANQKVFFGHQSVGFNIIEGIEQWEEDKGVQITKLESRNFSNISEAAFIHFRVGENANPISKIDDFVNQVGTIPIDSESIAFFKLCYVDINESTDVYKLFAYYKQQMYNIHKSHKKTKLVLTTIPITSIQKGWKSLIKKILGKVPFGYIENMKRQQFNSMLKDEFLGVFPIFDLAGIESTLPDGSIETYSYKGVNYPCMPDSYTSDMGHLNEYGRKVVSYNLLAFLADEVK